MVKHSDIDHSGVAGIGVAKLALPFPYTEATPPFTGNVVLGRVAVPDDYTVNIESIQFKLYVFTTNNGSNFWTVELFRVDSANTPTSLGSFNTSANSPNVWLAKKLTIGANLHSSAMQIRASATRNGTPGNLHGIGVVICTMTP